MHWNSKYSDFNDEPSKVMVTDKLGDVVNPMSQTTVADFDPSWIIPSRSSDGGIGCGSYWSYMGSLTQPKCFESI